MPRKIKRETDTEVTLGKMWEWLERVKMAQEKFPRPEIRGREEIQKLEEIARKGENGKYVSTRVY